MSVAVIAELAPEQPKRAVKSRSKPETVVVLLFTLLIAVLAVGGAASILRLLYPVLGTLVAVFLYFRSKPQYVSFVVWIWFLSAFVRRMADFHGGFQETSLILLTPYLVTAVSGLLLVRNPRGLIYRRNRPILLALAAIVYGFCVGLTKYSVVQMIPALLNWMVPLCLAYFLSESWSEYDEIKATLQKSYVYAALIMGVYAVYQFFIFPPWDRIWLENMRTVTFGKPEPMQVRDFSTMNAPVVFALCMTSVLLVVLSSRSKLRYFSIVAGLIGLILSLNRSSWLGFFAGLAFIVFRLSNRDRVRIISTLIIFVGVAAAGATLPGISEIVGERFQSFSSPGDDVSYQARNEGYGRALATLSREPFGEGVGSPDLDHPTSENDDAIGPHDSTLLELLYSVGWFGTVCYLSAVGIITYRSLASPLRSKFEISAGAVHVAFLAQSMLNIILSGPIGVFFWILAGMVLANSELRWQTSNLSPSSSSLDLA